MAFNVHQRLFSASGEYLEDQAVRYQDQLMQLFAESPEWQAFQGESRAQGASDAEQTSEEQEIYVPWWAGVVVDYAIRSLGVMVPDVTPDHLRTILFTLIPRRILAPPDVSSEIVRELRAFWTFLQRAFHLENAAKCLKVLDDKATRRLTKEMGNPVNFGVTKTLVMLGMERGLDLSTEEELQRWVETYNAEVAAGKGLRVPMPGEQSASAREVHAKLRRFMAQRGQE
jgi:hypothetical protein